jgi:hypothetical protein
MKRSFLAAALAVLLALASGCMMFCPEPSPERLTACGEIRINYPACRRLRVLHHTFERDDNGRLIVWVTWVNETPKPCKAYIRVAFLDENGLGERGSSQWDLHTFAPGEQPAIQWTSYSTDAVRYRIDVQSAR